MDALVAWVISRDPDMRRVIELNLCRRSIRCIDVTLGEMGVPSFKPQVIILDVDPPAGLDWEAARALRRTNSLHAVPLIVIATASPAASQLEALKPVFHVRKPLAMDELLAVVRECLNSADIPR
jgi:DNA-binding response OmpR family regulator